MNQPKWERCAFYVSLTQRAVQSAIADLMYTISVLRILIRKLFKIYFYDFPTVLSMLWHWFGAKMSFDL